jgi:hypothetical protein
MKTSSKVYFALGSLTTLGTITLAYYILKDSDKTPKQLLDEGQKIIKNTARKGDQFFENTIDSIKKETKSLLKDTSNAI